MAKNKLKRKSSKEGKIPISLSNQFSIDNEDGNLLNSKTEATIEEVSKQSSLKMEEKQIIEQDVVIDKIVETNEKNPTVEKSEETDSKKVASAMKEEVKQDAPLVEDVVKEEKISSVEDSKEEVKVDSKQAKVVDEHVETKAQVPTAEESEENKGKQKSKNETSDKHSEETDSKKVAPTTKEEVKQDTSFVEDSKDDTQVASKQMNTNTSSKKASSATNEEIDKANIEPVDKMSCEKKIEPVVDCKDENKEAKMTLEEKRNKERSKLMTIEERRTLQKEGKLPTTPSEPAKFSIHNIEFDYICFVLSMLMSWFITYRIFEYFSWGYALIFFLIVHLSLVGIFFLGKKNKKIGLTVNVILCIIMIILSVVVNRIGSFTDQVFDNSESESVMLVAKKDSMITKEDDFKDKKIAFIKSDGDTNTFAKEMLSEEKKESYKEVVYVTYKEAYEALENSDVDMMVYTSFTKQRLEEDDIQSWDQVKVIMQKNRTLKAVESIGVDISKDTFNIYISGVDLTSNSINEKGSSDVNIIMTVNPKTSKIIMQTIPRDTWAGLVCSNGEHTKLTYAGAYGGIDCSIKTIEEYLDIEINYYAKINFQGVIDLVDALGGVTVNSDFSFCESHPLDGYGVQNYCYSAGENRLNGIDALMFARIRKVLSNGDVERGRHQMEVVNAVIREFNESPSLTNINALLGAVEDNFTTNLSKDDIGKGLELLMGMQDSLVNIESDTMEGEFVWQTDEVTNEYLYYFVPYDGQADLIKQRIQDVKDGK